MQRPCCSRILGPFPRVSPEGGDNSLEYHKIVDSPHDEHGCCPEARGVVGYEGETSLLRCKNSYRKGQMNGHTTRGRGW